MLRRFYHLTAVRYSIKKQGLKLCKMVHPKVKKQWYPTSTLDDALPTLKSFTKEQNQPGKQGLRRVAMLNKLFMKHITDLMSTGTSAMNVVGRGIEISKVRITPDFHTVNVFWVCKGTTTDRETEAILNKTAGALRHELSTLRVMGEVPYIVFVKDKQEAQLVDLDRRLAVADYGEEYTPTEIGHLLKSEFTLNTKLSPEMRAKIKQLEDELPIVEELLPEMTHNVFGLDHAKIMNRLLAARKKSKDAWTNLDEASPVISYRIPTDASPEIDVGKQKQELAEFLLKRKILQDKLHKQLRDNRRDWQVTLKNDDDDEPYVDDDDDDYYEEDDFYVEEDSFHIEKNKDKDSL